MCWYDVILLWQSCQNFLWNFNLFDFGHHQSNMLFFLSEYHMYWDKCNRVKKKCAQVDCQSLTIKLSLMFQNKPKCP